MDRVDDVEREEGRSVDVLAPKEQGAVNIESAGDVGLANSIEEVTRMDEHEAAYFKSEDVVEVVQIAEPENTSVQSEDVFVAESIEEVQQIDEQEAVNAESEELLITEQIAEEKSFNLTSSENMETLVQPIRETGQGIEANSQPNDVQDVRESTSSPGSEDMPPLVLSVQQSDDDSIAVNISDFESVFRAARCGEFSDIIGALNERPNMWPTILGFRDQEGHSLLHWAALFNATDFIKSSCDEAAETSRPWVNARSHNGQTPIMWACIKGHLESMKLLFRRYGANINFSDSLKADIVTLAVQHHQYNAVLLLHKWLGRIGDSRDVGGCSAVHWAAYKGDVLMVRLLQYLRADMNAVDNQGMTPLHRATGEGWTEAALFLRQHCGADPKLVNNKNESSIDIAKRLGNRALLASLSMSDEEIKAEANGPLGSKWSLPLIFSTILSATIISFFADFFSEASLSIRVVFVVNLIVLILTYSDLLVGDPGFIPRRKPGQSAVEELQARLDDPKQTSPLIGETGITKICVTCWEMKDVNRRMKHCSVCDKCVESFDHHCGWINNCVASKNHREFVIMVFSVWAGMLLFMYISISRAVNFSGSFLDFLWVKPLIAPLWLIHVVVIPWLTILLGSQLRSIAINMNTNELMNMHRYAHFWEGPMNVFASTHQHVDGENCRAPQRRFRNPFDKGGMVANCMHFWCRRNGHQYQSLSQEEIEMTHVGNVV